MKNIWDKYGAKLIAFVIFAVIVLAVISVVAIFGGFIMRFFGFEYESIGSIILFFLIATILSYPINLIAKVLPNVLFHTFHRGTLGQARFLYVFIDAIGTALGLTVVDMFMESVSATEISIFVVSILFALYSVKDDVKSENEIA